MFAREFAVLNRTAGASLHALVAGVTQSLMGHGRAARRRRALRSASKVSLALAVLVFALSLVSGLAQGGRTYFYCEAMGMMTSDPCRLPPAGADGPVLGDAHTDCCETLSMPRLPHGTGSTARIAPADAPTLAVPSLVPSPEAGLVLSRASAEVPRPRACPPSPAARERRARLMVSLT